jgi:hypothetical protein
VLFDVAEDSVFGLGRVVWVSKVVIDVGAVSFVTGAYVDRLAEEFAVARLDGAAVDHERGSVVAGKCHDAARHVLVATWQSDAGIVVLGAGHGFDAVSDEFASLKRESHA